MNMLGSNDCTMLPLSGIRVIEFGQRLSGPYCGLLLAELGADVVKIEPPAGDPIRHKLCKDGAPFGPSYAALNRGKRIVHLDLKSDAGRRVLFDLIAAADAFITNVRPSALKRNGLDPAALLRLRPGLVYTSLSAAGWDSEDDAIGLDDGAAQAETGFMFATGWPGDGPVMAPLPVGAALSALYGAISVTAALSRPVSAALDCAMVDTLAACLEFPLMTAATLGVTPERNGGRHPTAAPSQPFRTGRGMLAIMATSPGEFERLARALERPDLANDPRFIDNEARMANRDALQAEIESLLADGDAETWFQRLAHQSIACAPIQSIAEAVTHPVNRERETIRTLDVPGGRADVIAIPGGRVRRGHADAPPLKECAASEIAWEPRPISSAGAHGLTSPDRLLEGIKVVDLSRFLAGPFATALLGDLGADILKIEPPGGDPTRNFRPKIDGESGYFTSINRGKRARTLDLKDPEDLRRLKREIADADLLVENFRPGVMDRLGLSDAELRRINPDLVSVSISGFGETGAYARRAAYDMTVQAFSGLMHQTGYPGSPPTRLGISLGDIGTALYASLAAVAGLAGRKRNGIAPPRMDVAMIDCLLALMEQLVVFQSVGEPAPARLGGQHAAGSPMGAFPTADGYVYFAAGSQVAFATLSGLLDAPEWLSDPRFVTVAARAENRELLVETVGLKTRHHEGAELVDRLRAAGIIAGIVRQVLEASESPLFVRRHLLRPCGPFRVVRLPVTELGRPIPAGELPAAPKLQEAADEPDLAPPGKISGELSGARAAG